MKILLMEDDLNLRESLEEELQDEGFDVLCASDSDEACDLSYDNKFDLYLLDVNVPGMSGYELLESLRGAGDTTPAIFLTSNSQTKDIGIGFDSGADDYITKPFNLEELLIRVRRFRKKSNIISLGKDLSYNPSTLKINENQLKKQEAQFLEYFVNNPNRIISKDEVINEVFESPISDGTFRVYVKNLKKATDGVEILKNIRGQGYIFERS